MTIPGFLPVDFSSSSCAAAALGVDAVVDGSVSVTSRAHCRGASSASPSNARETPHEKEPAFCTLTSLKDHVKKMDPSLNGGSLYPGYVLTNRHYLVPVLTRQGLCLSRLCCNDHH